MSSSVVCNICLKFDPRLRALVVVEAARHSVPSTAVVVAILCRWLRVPIPETQRRIAVSTPYSQSAKPYAIINVPFTADLYAALKRQQSLMKRQGEPRTLSEIVARRVALHFGRPDLAAVPRCRMGRPLHTFPGRANGDARRCTAGVRARGRRK